MKVLITGGSGQLGYDIIKVFKEKDIEIIHPTSIEMDITDKDNVIKVIQDYKTYGKYFGIKLSEENKKQFYISEGSTHGFLVLRDVAKFAYKVTDYYHPNNEGGIILNDSTINIKWPGIIKK